MKYHISFESFSLDSFYSSIIDSYYNNIVSEPPLLEKLHDSSCDVESLTQNTGEGEEQSNKNKAALLLVGCLLLTSLLIAQALNTYQ